jgi:hypothetical protein
MDLEARAIERATTRLSEADLAELERLLDVMETASANEDMAVQSVLFPDQVGWNNRCARARSGHRRGLMPANRVVRRISCRG